MNNSILSDISDLELLRGHPVLLYHSMVQDETIPILYEYLRKGNRIDHLDLVLSTGGGYVLAARRIAILLREYVQFLTILVPSQARSAGTLLCLSANNLVLTPLSELSPIDPLISAAGNISSDAPGLISAEDIRVFRRMAKDWFGVSREEDRLQVLAIVAQRIFPTSLSSFYRFDRMIRRIANELLLNQLPEYDESYRQNIVDQLVGGHFVHDHAITRSDAQQIGLKVSFASDQEEKILWNLHQKCREQTQKTPYIDEAVTKSLILGNNFIAKETYYWTNTPNAHHTSKVSDNQTINNRWEIES